MIALEPAYIRRRTHHGRHCKPIYGDDALDRLGRDALLVLRHHGAELIAAEGRRLTAFALTETDEQIKATVEWCIDLPREAAAVADVGDDALITWVHDGHTVLGRANRH